MLAAIFGVSLLAWALIAGKWLVLRERAGDRWAREAIGRLRDGDRAGAAALCRRRPGPIGRIVLESLRMREPERRFFESRVRPVLESEAVHLRRHLGLIAALGAVSPLLGLLGTVVGMIGTFDALTPGGPAGVDRLAGGVSQALLTTQAGLMVGLPILLVHGYLRSRIQRRIDTAALLMKKIETILCHD